MFRTVAILLLTFIVGVGLYGYTRKTIQKPVEKPKKVTSSPTPEYIKNVPGSSSVFVPYWTMGKSAFEGSEYDAFIYFGVTASTSGILRSEPGYTSLDRFTSLAGNNKTLLTLRLLDSKTDFAILESKQIQKKIITETITLAKDEGFEGIVLDMELNGLPFDSLLKQINSYVADFAKEAKSSGLSFSMTMYGDTFYRIRPFDVKTLAGSVDHMYVMAYDFHKSRGNPGPNFPFSGKETYGYDFQTMTEDFLQVVPREKLTIIFGMFGYDWMVGEKGIAIQNGEALSTYKVESLYTSDCAFKNCLVKRDEKSGETKVSYTDGENKNHILWFEDERSVSKKKSYLEEKGITSYSYWAYGYF